MPPHLTQVPLTRAIIQLSWPAITSMLLVNLVNLVDAFWVGKLGTDALGGMTASAFLVWCFHSAGMLVGTGVNAMVARRVGEQQDHRAGRAGAHGLLLALAAAALVMGIGLPTQGPVLASLDLKPAVITAGMDYLTPILYGFPSITLWYAVDAIFRGSGDTRSPMQILAICLLFNAVLDPLLIFGAGPIPALGIAGAGWATVAAHAMSVALGLIWLRRRAVRPTFGSRPMDPKTYLSLLRIGTPIGVTTLLFSLIYIALTPIISTVGSAAVAAIGVGHRLEGVCYFSCMGFSTAAATLVGQYLGAGDPDRAARAAWATTGISAAFLGVIVLIFLVFAPQLIGIFSDDPEVIAQGALYLRIVAVFEVAMAPELVLEGAFSGAGNSMPPMLVGVPLTAVRVPLAHLLCRTFGWGAAGIWWAISVTTLLKGAALMAWFAAGRWKHTRV